MLETKKRGSSVPVETCFCQLKSLDCCLSAYLCRLFRRNDFLMKIQLLSSILKAPFAGAGNFDQGFCCDCLKFTDNHRFCRISFFHF